MQVEVHRGVRATASADLHFDCLNAVLGLLPVCREPCPGVERCEGRPPLPHHFVCVEMFTLPYVEYLITPCTIKHHD